MKKIVFGLSICLLTLTGCGEKNLYEGPVTPPVDPDPVKENADQVFGYSFDPNQDWCSTTTGQLSIYVNASVKKVQLLVEVCEVLDDDTPSYVTRNSMKILNEAAVDGEGTLTMNYDAPKDNLGLYVAFTTDTDYLVKKVSGTSVSIDDVVSNARTRALDTDYNLPEGDFTIADIHKSYAAERHWNDGELLYDLSDASYAAMKMSSNDYSPEFTTLFRSIVFSCFPNGRNYKNLQKVIDSGYYNEGSYAITTGKPVIVTPVYKCDHPAEYGNEVYYSELYYYYFKDSDLEGKDAVEYLKQLPKYKAFPMSMCFTKDADDDIIKRFGSFALLYFGDGVPEVGAKGTFEFPEGYKIGFMVRANTDWDQGRKKGEVYCDGRLNNQINTSKDFNFSTSGLKAGDPRGAWLTVNKKKLLCWESGTDSDFNDIIMEVEGIEGGTPPPTFDKNTYTFCFEDTETGDYDMNDVVIRGKRIDETTVEYSIIACGAYDELYINNITDEIANTEVHALFGKEPKQFVNTNGSDCEPYTLRITVNKTFSFTDESTQPSIYDATTGTTIHLAHKGQNPHGIMVPYLFKYPIERVCIKDAYPLFNNWGQSAVTSTGWYMSPDLSKVCNN